MLACLAAALPGTAAAGRAQESILQDDHALYYEGVDGQAQALDTMGSLGVDTIHSVVRWRFFAPRKNRSKPPKHFDGRDPASYPADRWDTLDDIVRGARARGIDVLLSPSSPSPDWAGRCTGKARKRYRGNCKPNPRLFGQFVRAVARRYSGTYPDESDGRVLPRVNRWSIWNEPDLAAWLYPQVKRVNGRRVYVGATAYRGLVRAATAALRATGHARDQVLLGETAPLGSSSGVAPAAFYRALFCLDSRGRRLRGADAAAHGCRRVPRLAVTGVAHHPYTRGAGTRLLGRVGRDDITIAVLSRLTATLRQGARVGAIPRAAASQVYLTEFGVSSKPPGRRFSVPLGVQAKWINQADYLAYRNPLVRSVAQYELQDDVEYSRTTFKTGLCFRSQASPCYPKPAFDAYRVPLYVVRRGRSVTVFGGSRLADTGMAERIEIQHRPPDGEFIGVRTVSLNSTGWFFATLPNAAGSWRLAFTPAAGGETLYSREARAETR
ncbi:MAG TPA: hypothetical protein VF545_11840 [Thermoleophilaceae bacterium]